MIKNDQNIIYQFRTLGLKFNFMFFCLATQYIEIDPNCKFFKKNYLMVR